MREILFRGKSTGGNMAGKWIFGFYVNGFWRANKNEHGIMPTLDENLGGYFEVAPETVCQYTGLTDKNGTKIFEGDIVKVTYTGRNKGLDGIAPVVFDGCMFGLVWGWHKELHCLSGFSNVEFEVIGNIYDNPELLKGGENNG